MINCKINLNGLFRFRLQIVFIVCMTFICYERSKAQVSVFTGVNVSTVRSNITIENKEPSFGMIHGGSIQFYPFSKVSKLSVINGLSLTQKGYDQDFHRKYSFNFLYFSVPVLLSYDQ